MSQNKNLLKSVENIIFNCGCLKRDEKVLILYDSSTKNIIKYFKKTIMKKTINIKIITLSKNKHDGLEPKRTIRDHMISSDLIVCLTKKSLAHTRARYEANKKGAKYLSLPDYSKKVLLHKSARVNFKRYFKEAGKLTKILNKGNEIKVFTKLGTNLSFFIKNRKANFAPGICNKKGSLASPPDSEVNIAVIENKSNGIAVIDGSITTDKLGKLKSPLKLEIKNGSVVNIIGKKAKLLENIFNSQNKKAKIIGEFGIGLNHKAEVVGNMLIDEGSRGNIHLGIGSNFTIGGKNKVNFHLDHIIKKPSVFVDQIKIIDNGKLI